MSAPDPGRVDVVQVLLSPRIGGAESLAATLQAEWRRMGLRAETVYLDPEVGTRSPGARVRHLRAELRRRSPRALLAHSALPNAYARMVAPAGIAVCTVMHGGDDFTDRKLRYAERVLRLRTTAVVTVNESQRQQYRARFGRRVPVERIPNAISSDMSPRTGIRAEPTSAVTVARVVQQKQPEFWAAVADAAATELPGLRFDWWGPLGDEPEVARARARVEAVPSATFRGSTAEPDRAYAAADLLFHPSRAEAQSIGLLEAAATGLPIVCSEPVGRTLDARVPRAEFADGDVADAIRALRTVLDDWDRTARAALDAAPSILRDYSAAACAARYLAVLGLEGAPHD